MISYRTRLPEIVLSKKAKGGTIAVKLKPVNRRVTFEAKTAETFEASIAALVAAGALVPLAASEEDR